MQNLRTIKAFYRLTEQKSLSLATAHSIVSHLGDPTEYVGKKSKLWTQIDYLKDDVKNSLMSDIDPPNWLKIIAFIEHTPDFKFISILDDDYPELLKNIYNPPLFFTALGDISLLHSDKIISIVGTRKPTQYGRYVTEKIVESLLTYDFIICSGLALGIDAVAHRKTVDGDGKTIAVLACGLDTIYPPQNRELARRVKQNGLIISESMPYKKFEKYHFPQRNRIIAGLCQAVCVIEGNLTSGALITAKFGLNCGKEVYALPGDIIRPESAGPNFLISKGAKAILSPGDVVADFCVDYTQKIVKIDLNDEEQTLYDIIKASNEVHIDTLAMQTGQSISELSGILFMLELKNAVRLGDSGKYLVCGEC